MITSYGIQSTYVPTPYICILSYEADGTDGPLGTLSLSLSSVNQNFPQAPGPQVKFTLTIAGLEQKGKVSIKNGIQNHEERGLHAAVSYQSPGTRRGHAEYILRTKDAHT